MWWTTSLPASMYRRVVQRIRACGSIGPHIRQDVAVEVERDPNLGMTVALARRFRMDTALSCRPCRPNARFAELVRLTKASLADEHYAERSGKSFATGGALWGTTSGITASREDRASSLKPSN